MNLRFVPLALTFVLATLLATTAMALAQSDEHSVYRGGTYWGSVIVEPNQIVDGNLYVFLGNADIEGTVNGDVYAVGDINLNGGTINGRAHAIFGSVVQTLVPWAPDADAPSATPSDSHISWRVAWDIVILVVFLIFPVRARMALGRVESHPALATAAGLFGWIAVLCLAVIMVFTFILIPLVPIELALVVVAVCVGHAALSLLIGRRLYELIQPHATPSPLIALALGLALLTAAELVPYVGFFVMLLVALVGLGSVILTFVPDVSRSSGSPPRPTISGPPAPIA